MRRPRVTTPFREGHACRERDGHHLVSTREPIARRKLPPVRALDRSSGSSRVTSRQASKISHRQLNATRCFRCCRDHFAPPGAFENRAAFVSRDNDLSAHAVCESPDGFEPMHHAPIATDPTSPSGGCESWSWQRVGALGLSCPGDKKVHITRRSFHASRIYTH